MNYVLRFLSFFTLQIFDHTFGILVGRYSKVTPSAKRLQQFRADVTTILLIAR